MERTAWVKPMTLVQKFEANEPVAALGVCYQVKCESKAEYKVAPIRITGSGAPEYHWSHKEGYYDWREGVAALSIGFKHKNCVENPSSNVFNVDTTNPSDPVITYIMETSGSAEAGAFEHWLDYNGSGVFDEGDIIYWTNLTVGSTGTRWNHWGYVKSVDPMRKNHS